MFQPNDELLTQFYEQDTRRRDETFVDFGVVPADPEDRADWSAEVQQFLSQLKARRYQFVQAMPAGQETKECPLFTVRLDRGDFNGPTPVEISYFSWVVKRMCSQLQSVHVRGQVVEIHVLPSEQEMGAFSSRG